jgi:hypothetical protein
VISDEGGSRPACEVLRCPNAAAGRVFLPSLEARTAVAGLKGGIAFLWLCPEHRHVAARDSDGLLRLLDPDS